LCARCFREVVLVHSVRTFLQNFVDKF
ncbi:MAG: hypothetical protein QOF10_5306, partial [Kribbellaceae bacterium]|nr:hypothetical protein [Kribbellaceae bacterium]